MIKLIKKYFSGILSIIVLIAIVVNIYIDKKRNKLLEKSIDIKGVLFEKYTEGKNKMGTFEFKLKNSKIKFDYIGDFSFLQIGDTVLIQYAIEDPSVARVKDRYYMRKYKYLKK
jgi:hypothetical protein